MNNPLLELALMSKSAAVNTSGTQVVPYQIVPSAASGLYEPDDRMAGYTALSNMRVDALYQATLGNDVNPGNSGTDLIPYAGVLNQGYGTVNWATTRAQSPIGKQASMEFPFMKAANYVAELGYDPLSVDVNELAAIEDELNSIPSQEAWESGIFEHESLVPTEGEMDEVYAQAEKSASANLVELGLSMANEGILDIPQINDGNPYFAQYVIGRLTGQI